MTKFLEIEADKFSHEKTGDVGESQWRFQDHVFNPKSKKRLVMTKSVGGCGLLQDRLIAGIVRA